MPGTIFENNFDLKGKIHVFLLSAAFFIFLMGSSLLFCLNAVFYLCYSRRGPTTSIFKPDINSIVHSHYCQCSNTNIAFVFVKATHQMLIKCILGFFLPKQSGIKGLHLYQFTIRSPQYLNHQPYSI